MVNLITNIPIQYGREDGGEANFEYLHQLQADGLTDEKLEKYGMEGFSYIQKADRDTALMKDAEKSDEHKKTGESIYRNCFLRHFGSIYDLKISSGDTRPGMSCDFF